MNTYNLLIDSQLIADGTSIISGNGLQSGFFDLPEGESTITIEDLEDCTIHVLFRESDPYAQVTGTPGTKEFKFTSSTGFIEFNSSLTFNDDERLFVIYTSAGTQTGTEPVTIQEAKDYLRLEGFIDDSETLDTEFDDDDELISDLITSARVRLEEFTGLSFMPKTWKIQFTNLAGNFVIPYGPVIEVVRLEYEDGTEITDYTMTFNNSKIKLPLAEDLVMTYYTGYSTLPKGLKMAILKQVAYDYSNRGDMEDKGLCQGSINLASTYKEVGTWLG